MNLDINNDHHLELIAKYITDEMDNEERQNFEQLLLLNDQNSLIVKEMSEAWNISKMKTKPIDTEQAWEKVKSQLDIKSSYTQTKHNPNRKWFQFASAAVFTLILGISLFFSLQYNRNGIIVQTADNQDILVHSLPDGTIIYMNKNSELKYSKRFGRSNRNIELHGEAFFDVKPDKKLPFLIETQAAMIEVVGTSFSVKSSSNKTFELLVSSGIVAVTSKKNNEFTQATVGEKIRISENKLLKEVSDEKRHIPLFNRQFMFKDELLENVSTIMEKNFEINIHFNPENLKEQRITATFSAQSVESMIEIICRTMQLEATTDGKKVILSKSSNDKR